jgi:hypothetical protein
MGVSAAGGIRPVLQHAFTVANLSPIVFSLRGLVTPVQRSFAFWSAAIHRRFFI